MAKVEWTEEAEARLREIHDYIAQDKPEAAFRLVQSIYRRVQVLASSPRIGHRWQERPDRDIRIFLYGHYRIPYLITETGDIHVLGVFHGAMDLKRHLK